MRRGFEDLFNRYDRNQRRMAESKQIAEAGPLVAALRASVVHFRGVPEEAIERVRDQVEERYNILPRNQKIEVIQDTAGLVDTFVVEFNPCRETEIAMNTRRLTVIQHIVRAGAASGDLAVETADILMGNLPLRINEGELVTEFSAHAHIH